MSEQPPFDVKALPSWLQDAVASALPQRPDGPAPPPSDPAVPTLPRRDEPAWRLLLDAAVVSTFMPRDLAPDVSDPSTRREAEKVVCEFAETTYVPSGRRWSLPSAIRAAVVDLADKTEIDAAIARTSLRFVDGVSRALREYLERRGQRAGAAGNLDELEAQRVAVASLAGASSLKPQLPPLEQLDRQIELRRVLDQFARMVGERPTADATGRRDRFFGRSEELETLHEFVGVLPPETLRHQAARWVKSIGRTLRGRGALTVFGVGGVGKTTLMAKFMLEHARAGADRFPFAYLDLDRSSLSARNPVGLLAEMCQQAATQFDALAAPMADLRLRLRELAPKTESAAGTEIGLLLQPYTREFRARLDQLLDDLQSRFERQRPFLLVVDTFEVAQYSDDDVEALQAFLEGFRVGGAPWPRLRLVISGRRRVDSFLGPTERLEVGELDPSGSIDLLTALASDAGRPIAVQDAAGLIAALQGALRRRQGVHPLQLRLVGEVFKQETAQTGPQIAESLTRELLESTLGEGTAARVLVDGILVRRILGHVRDRRVQALADPGLVVRRITWEVIQNVMTRATDRPALPGTGEAPLRQAWSVDETEARSIFQAFALEVSLVEPDGAALRHRPDIRAEMLPLIRARSASQFDAVHQLAYHYFSECVRRDPKDLASAGEAVYHGLWCGVPLLEVDKLWPPLPTFDPRIDPDEFDPGSDANIYVRAKRARPLGAHEVRRLPAPLAVQWLEGCAGDLLKASRVGEAMAAVEAVLAAAPGALDRRPHTAAAVARIHYRSGQWQGAMDIARAHLEASRYTDVLPSAAQPPWADVDASVSLLRTATTIDARTGTNIELSELVLGVIDELSDPIVRTEILSQAVVASLRPGNRRPTETTGRLRERLTHVAHGVRPGDWQRELRVLRLGLLAGGRDLFDLLPVDVGSRERLSRDPSLAPTVLRVLEATGQTPPASLEALASAVRDPALLDAVDAAWRTGKRAVAERLSRGDHALAEDLWVLIAYDHADWHTPLGNALQRDLAALDGGDLRRDLEAAGLTPTGDHRDGLAIVRAIGEGGRLLELSELLVYRPAGTDTVHALEGTRGPRPVYPQNAVALAAALLRWHEAIVNGLNPASFGWRQA
jgi:hypothetical protein